MSGRVPLGVTRPLAGTFLLVGLAMRFTVLAQPNESRTVRRKRIALPSLEITPRWIGRMMAMLGRSPQPGLFSPRRRPSNVPIDTVGNITHISNSPILPPQASGPKKKRDPNEDRSNTYTPRSNKLWQRW